MLEARTDLDHPHFKTSPEIIRLAVLMHVRFPLSLRNGMFRLVMRPHL